MDLLSLPEGKRRELKLMGNVVKTQIPFWSQVRQSSQLVWSFIMKTTTQEDNFAWEYAFAIMKFLTSLQQIWMDVSRATSIFTAQSPGQGLLYLEIIFFIYTFQSSSFLLSTAPQRCWINFLLHLWSSESQLYQGIFSKTDPASRQYCLHKREL